MIDVKGRFVKKWVVPHSWDPWAPASLLAAALWTTWGCLEADVFVAVPNGIGLLLSLAQVRLLLMTLIASITSRRPMSLATFAAVTTTFLGFLRFLRNFHS